MNIDETNPKLIWTTEKSLLSDISTPNGCIFHYLVKGTPLVLIPSKQVDKLSLTILDYKMREVPEAGILVQNSDSVIITLSMLSKGNSYFILQLKDQTRIVHEVHVKSISSHQAVQILRQQQKIAKVKRA